MHTGLWSPIPNDAHYISIVGYKNLTTNQQSLLRNYIVKHHLDISLKEATPSSPLLSSEIIEKLQLFVSESKALRPRSLDMFYSWLLIIFMFALPIYVSYHKIGYNNIMFHDRLRYFHNLMYFKMDGYNTYFLVTMVTFFRNLLLCMGITHCHYD